MPSKGNRLHRLFRRAAVAQAPAVLAPEMRAEFMNNTALGTSQSVLKKFLDLSAPYWGSKEAIKGVAMLASLLGMSYLQIKYGLELNEWRGAFTDAMSNKNAPEIYSLITRFCEIVAPLVGIAVSKPLLKTMLQLDWRTSMTRLYTNRYLSNGAADRIENEYRNIDNPDQRISDDLGSVAGMTINLFVGGLTAMYGAWRFGGVLWEQSQGIGIGLGPYTVPVDHGMLWFALGYCAIGTGLSLLIGRPLIKLNQKQQELEANYRRSLIRLRENAEAIRLYHGEEVEKVHLTEQFNDVRKNVLKTMKFTLGLDFYQSSYGQAAVIVPYFMALPTFLKSNMTFGGMNQVIGAFGNFQDHISYLIDTTDLINSWKAAINRVTEIRRGLDLSDQESQNKEKARLDLPASELTP